MILSNLLLSAWILNTYTVEDQKLYLSMLHLRLNSKKVSVHPEPKKWVQTSQNTNSKTS